MSAPKHTPGPWKAGRRDAYEINITSPSRFIADIYNATVKVGNGYPTAAEADANAALVAAAPDLLQALRDILAYSGIDPDADTRMGLREVNAARAAIAKAEGRQS